MDARTGLFYVFAAILLFAAFRVITARNPVHAALYLVLAFFQAAAIWLLLKAEFLAITLVLVYVGAVMVLFLFVVMMLDVNMDSMREGFWKHFPLAGSVGAVIALEMSYVLMGGFREPPKSARRFPTPKSLARFFILSTSTLWRSPRLYCWWPSLPPLP
jgi:NADH-quinone oxidoreductase subunit J